MSGETLYRITVRKPGERTGTAITRIHPLARARRGMVAGVALRFTFAESAEVMAALSDAYPGLSFARVLA